MARRLLLHCAKSLRKIRIVRNDRYRSGTFCAMKRGSNEGVYIAQRPAPQRGLTCRFNPELKGFRGSRRCGSGSASGTSTVRKNRYRRFSRACCWNPRMGTPWRWTAFRYDVSAPKYCVAFSHTGGLAYRLCGTAKGRVIREPLAAGQASPTQDPGALQLHASLDHDSECSSPAFTQAKPLLAAASRTRLPVQNQLARLHTLGVGLDFLLHTHYQ
jgi:hypothetical protein